MKSQKTEFRFFAVPEWEKEQDYLRRRHQEGWRFVRLNFFCLYHFERCAPEDVVYQLDYNPEGLAHRDEYVQMFRDCGWEYLQDYLGYSYFRKAAARMQGDEHIFCDDASRLDMMRRVFKGRMVPLLIIFFLVILPNLFIQSHADTGAVGSALFVLYLVLFGFYIALFAYFGYQFLKLVHPPRR